MKRYAPIAGVDLLLLMTCLLTGCYLPMPNPAIVTSLPVSAEISIPEPEAGTVVLWTDHSYFVYVPTGEFIMGQDETEPSDHSPAHTVLLEGFWVHQTEVTNRMYTRCVALGICSPPHQETGIPYRYNQTAHANDPVVGVDWYQAQAYCEWIDGQLPIEAEWEKAARGTAAEWEEETLATEVGPYPYPYPWGEDQPTCDLLNFAGCLDPGEPQHVRSYPLGASLYNAADLAGNVSEWNLEIYDEDAYSPIPTPTPTGRPSIETRVVRGSNYESSLEELPVYLRVELKPEEHSELLGFRCVLTGETVANPPPPACAEVVMDIPPLEQVTAVPYTPPTIEINPFCSNNLEGDPFGIVNLVFSEPVTPEQYNLSASLGTPIVSYEPALPNILSVSGIPLELAFQLTVCPTLSEPPALPTHPECPPGYSYDSSTQLCYFGHNPDYPFMCAGESVPIPGFGCLPEPVCGICPVGYFVGEYEGNPACIPVGIPDLYTLTDCLEGMLLDPENTCCQLPPGTYEPICPAGFSLDPGGTYCAPEYEGEPCQTFDVYIPTCPPHRCVNPSQYTNQGTCETGYCRWTTSPTGGQGYCTYP